MTEPIWTEAEANVGLKAGVGRIMQLEGEVQRLTEQLEQLRTQFGQYVHAAETENAAMRAVVEAARAAIGGSMGGYVALKETLARLDATEKARTATPEGMQSEPPSTPPQPEQAT